MTKMTNLFGCFILLAVCGIGDSIMAGNKTEQELRQNLLKDYDKSAKPVGTTTVNIKSLTVHNFDMHEADHSVELFTWIAYDWKDSRLNWSSESHSGISHIGMDPTSVWTPDLTVYNSASGPATQLGAQAQLPMVVYSSGTVLSIPAVHIHFACVMDLTYWPHDTHNCSMKLGSWVHNAHLLDFVITNFDISLEVPGLQTSQGNISRSEWTITDNKAWREEKTYACCEEIYVTIHISLLISRNAPAYSWTVKMPAACLSILTLVMFILPPGAGEKIIFGGLCLVLDLLYIDYTSYAINHAPSHTPLLVQMVCQQVVLLMVSLIVCAIVIRITKDPHSTGMPPIMKGPVVSLAYILCLGNYASLASGTYNTFARTVKSDEVELGDECGDLRRREKSESNEWLILAVVVDRLFFILYLATCIITLIRFSSVL